MDHHVAAQQKAEQELHDVKAKLEAEEPEKVAKINALHQAQEQLSKDREALLDKMKAEREA